MMEVVGEVWLIKEKDEEGSKQKHAWNMKAFFGDQTETGVRANIWRYIDTQHCQQALKVM
jgi:hypothetical protein